MEVAHRQSGKFGAGLQISPLVLGVCVLGAETDVLRTLEVIQKHIEI